jgi:serine/threonine protein kinase
MKMKCMASAIEDTAISYIAHGKDDTLIISGDKLSRMFPGAIVRVTTCMGARGKNTKTRTKTIEISVDDYEALKRVGIDAKLAVKRVMSQELAIIESDINEYLWHQFDREGIIDSSSMHPNICKIEVRLPLLTDRFSDTGIRLIPMRRFAIPLSSAIRRWPKNEPELRGKRAISIAKTILKSLRVIHSLGFVHLDIKPSNILMEAHEDDSRVAMTDFETLMRAEDLMERVELNREAAFYVGTVRYMSPVLLLKVSSLFRTTCAVAGISPSDPKVHASRMMFEIPTICDMHSLAMTLVEITGAHQYQTTPEAAKVIRTILCAKSALECDIIEKEEQHRPSSPRTPRRKR